MEFASTKSSKQVPEGRMLKQTYFILAIILFLISTAIYYNMQTYPQISLSTMCDCNSPTTESCMATCEETLEYHRSLMRYSIKSTQDDQNPAAINLNSITTLPGNKATKQTPSNATTKQDVTGRPENLTVNIEEVDMPNGELCDACLQGKQLITVQRGWICGQPRIGNKMFMLLPAITAADQYNATLVLFKHAKDCEWINWLQDIFEYLNTSTPLISQSMAKDWWNIGEPGFTGYTSNNFKVGENYTFAGYRQNWHYIETAQQQRAARKVFTLTAKYKRFAQQRFDKAREYFINATDPLYVGVHMRIGDLKDKTRLDYGYQMAKIEFYEAAMQQVLLDLTPRDVIFMVASDSPSQAKKMLRTSQTNFNIFLIWGSDFQDFATLSKCDHSIISGGTYGFWTAWLAGGTTYYHANFAKPGSKFAAGFKNENFYLPEWIPVNELNVTTPKTPDVILPNNKTCHQCLAGKQLVIVQKGWLCSSPRIGQKMFMLAPAIASTATHNTTLVFYQQDADCDWISEIQDLFEEFNNLPRLKYSLTEYWDNLGEANSSSYNADDLYVSGKNYTYSGYRHNWNYVQSQSESDAVRRMFKFTDKYENHSKQTLDKVKSVFSNITSRLIIGVHVRIGDLHQQEKIDFGHSMANTSFYKAAIKQASQTFSDRNIIFLIASDTIDEAKTMLESIKTPHHMYFITGTAFEDLSVLSKCDHMIISGGPFGYWSAWLAGGKVFYFSDFAKEGTEFAKVFHNEDFFRPDWISIDEKRR